MGADMIAAVVAHEKGAKIDFEGGREFLKKIKIDDLNLNELCDQYGLEGEEFFDEDDKPIEEAIRNWLVSQVDEFVEAFDSRAVACFHVRDLVVYVTGGMSWGDVNPECDSFWFVGAIPGLASAMGFVEDWTQEDPTVTPEEEAAAVQSIVGLAGVLEGTTTSDEFARTR